MIEQKSYSLLEHIFSLALSAGTGLVLLLFADPSSSGISIVITLTAFCVFRGWRRSLHELRSILSDCLDLCKYFLSLGHWPTLGDERPLVHATQCVSLLSCYAWGYGLYSKTLRMPIENTVTLIEFWSENPHLTPKLLGMIFFRVVPLAVMSCTFAHIASHRYFSHKSFRTSRAFQMFLSVLAAFSSQRGALWWSSTHRRHHRACGTDLDPHGAKAGGGGAFGFLYSHIGWLLSREHFPIEFGGVVDWWVPYPELLLLEAVSPLIHMAWRTWLEDQLGLSATVLGLGYSLHFEGLINSYCHTAEHSGETHTCDSLDSFITAILTGGEGFHYGHHKDPRCACHGWQWGVLKYCDLTYSVLCVLEKLGIVWDVRHPKLGVVAVQKQK